MQLILAILTCKPARRLAAKIIEAGVRSTKTRWDDTLAAPVIKFLRE